MEGGAPSRDWFAEIDAWTERFRRVADPPEPFATAIRDGWTSDAKQALADAAEAYAQAHTGYRTELAAAGVDLVRVDQKQGNCEICRPYDGCAYSLTGATEDLPDPPPLPICPACRHTLSMVTPFFLQSLGLSVDDLAATTVRFTPPD